MNPRTLAASSPPLLNSSLASSVSPPSSPRSGSQVLPGIRPSGMSTPVWFRQPCLTAFLQGLRWSQKSCSWSKYPRWRGGPFLYVQSTAEFHSPAHPTWVEGAGEGRLKRLVRPQLYHLIALSPWIRDLTVPIPSFLTHKTGVILSFFCESEMRSAKLRRGTGEKIVMVNTRENLWNHFILKSKYFWTL